MLDAAAHGEEVRKMMQMEAEAERKKEKCELETYGNEYDEG